MSTTQAVKSKPRASEGLPKETNAFEGEALDLYQTILMLFGPLIEFHKSNESATMDDVRMFWDVRLVRGNDTPLAHITGSTTFPSMLSNSMMPEAPSKVEQEITNKILMPLVATAQREVNRLAFEPRAPSGAASGLDNWKEDHQPKPEGNCFPASSMAAP